MQARLHYKAAKIKINKINILHNCCQFVVRNVLMLHRGCKCICTCSSKILHYNYMYLATSSRTQLQRYRRLVESVTNAMLPHRRSTTILANIYS